MDFQTFLKKLEAIFSHPFIKLVVMPLTFVLFGFQFGSRIGVGGRVNVFGMLTLYVFVLAMQLVEQYLFISDARKGRIKKESLTGFWLILGLLILLLTLMTNVMFGVLALIYVVGVHLLYLPFKLKGSMYYLILQVFLKSVTLTVLASFIQINLVTVPLLLSILPIASGLLFYYSQMEHLDLVKYGRSSLDKAQLNILSLFSVVMMVVFPIALGKLRLTNILLIVLFGLLTFSLLRFMTQKKRFVKIGRSKNYLSTLHTFYILLLCLL